MKKTGILLLVAMDLLGCSKSVPPPNVVESEKPAANVRPADSAPVAEAPPEQATPASGRGVKTEMHNVMFHLTDKTAARLETLSGELWPIGKNEMPVFDDKTSFEVRVSSGRVSITLEGLSSILNDYVFAKKDAPLKDLSVSIDKGQLVIKGKLHSKGDIPFETKGTVSTTPDGRLRVHTEKVKALHVPMKGVMGVFGIELADVVNTSKIDGLDTDKNDLVMDLGMLLPPPHIKGKVTAVKIEKITIVTIFGDGAKISAPMREKGNYMYFEGNAVRFGKLIMENTDLTVLDIDKDDALDWSQDHYKDQLVAGYSKITPSFGLRAYVKDYSKLPHSQTNTSSRAPAN
jgi:hypothetical protein